MIGQARVGWDKIDDSVDFMTQQMERDKMDILWLLNCVLW